MKRTLHGEALQERCGGNVIGMRPKRRFFFRSVWCARCGAAPNRKCRPMDGDQHLTKARRLADGLAVGGVHRERLHRADILNDLASRSAEALYRLAVARGALVRPVRSTVDPSRLPLFRTEDPS